VSINPQLRADVVARAERRCEYCGIPDRLQVGGFELDHIIPQTLGGPTTLQNLAYACPHCNGNKSDHTHGFDEANGESVALFSPRIHRWTDHFRWSAVQAFEIEGITATGRATISRLNLNHPQMVAIRRALAELGISVMFSS
jgi:hypothetical protein